MYVASTRQLAQDREQYIMKKKGGRKEEKNYVENVVLVVMVQRKELVFHVRREHSQLAKRSVPRVKENEIKKKKKTCMGNTVQLVIVHC